MSGRAGPLLDRRGRGALIEAVDLGDGLLCPGYLWELVSLWRGRSESGMGVRQICLTLQGLTDFTDWRCNFEWASSSAIVP